MKKKRLLDAAAPDRILIGPNLQIPSPWLVEIIANAGFDFVMLDGEHGGAYSDLSNLIIAADGAGIAPIVRVPAHDRGWLLPPLEFGAAGVQVPMVNTAEQAERIVSEVKYTPVGSRGFSGITRAAGYGSVAAERLARLGNESVVLIVQLETREALENCAEIARVSGVDMVFIGPSDLGQSLGLPGRTESDEVVGSMKRIIREIDGRVPVATVAANAEDVRRWSALGVRCFLTSSMNPIRTAFEVLAADLRSGRGDRE